MSKGVVQVMELLIGVILLVAIIPLVGSVSSATKACGDQVSISNCIKHKSNILVIGARAEFVDALQSWAYIDGIENFFKGFNIISRVMKLTAFKQTSQITNLHALGNQLGVQTVLCNNQFQPFTGKNPLYFETNPITCGSVSYNFDENTIDSICENNCASDLYEFSFSPNKKNYVSSNLPSKNDAKTPLAKNEATFEINGNDKTSENIVLESKSGFNLFEKKIYYNKDWKCELDVLKITLRSLGGLGQLTSEFLPEAVYDDEGLDHRSEINDMLNVFEKLNTFQYSSGYTLNDFINYQVALDELTKKEYSLNKVNVLRIEDGTRIESKRCYSKDTFGNKIRISPAHCIQEDHFFKFACGKYEGKILCADTFNEDNSWYADVTDDDRFIVNLFKREHACGSKEDFDGDANNHFESEEYEFLNNYIDSNKNLEIFFNGDAESSDYSIKINENNFKKMFNDGEWKYVFIDFYYEARISLEEKKDSNMKALMFSLPEEELLKIDLLPYRAPIGLCANLGIEGDNDLDDADLFCSDLTDTRTLCDRYCERPKLEFGVAKVGFYDYSETVWLTKNDYDRNSEAGYQDSRRLYRDCNAVGIFTTNSKFQAIIREGDRGNLVNDLTEDRLFECIIDRTNTVRDFDEDGNVDGKCAEGISGQEYRYWQGLGRSENQEGCLPTNAYDTVQLDNCIGDNDQYHENSGLGFCNDNYCSQLTGGSVQKCI